MRQTLWQRLTYRPVMAWNHHLRRCCTCHKWPWQTWEEHGGPW